MKKWLILLMTALLLAALTGCTGKTEAETAPSATPMASADPNEVELFPDDMTPDASAGPGVTGGMSGTTGTMTGVTTAARARDAVEKLEEELVRLSEVKDAEVIVAGTTAVVGLEFDAQYRSGVTERLEKMVRERVKGVVSGIENVIVTGDADVMKTLASLGDRLDGAADMTALETELEKLIDRIRQMA